MIRQPIVAGRFYPLAKETLTRELAKLCRIAPGREDTIGAVSPHAGYEYSGAVAANVLGSLKSKKTYIILGPNHTGIGHSFSLSSATGWKTPLGEIPVDQELAETIAQGSSYIRYDESAHAQEHSIEVQLPFLQYRHKEFNFVPIVCADAPLDMYRAVGSELACAVKALRREEQVAFIASSDMTHYELLASARKKDAIAIDAILRLDEAALIQAIAEHDISMCGYAPAAIMLSAAKLLGAKKARLVDYRTSGAATGDYTSVVGYAGIIIT